MTLFLVFFDICTQLANRRLTPKRILAELMLDEVMTFPGIKS